MKKNIIYLLLAFVAVIFASCNPLKDAINDIKSNPADLKTMTIASTSNYESVVAANAGISIYLNTTYPQMPNGTKANVTYNASVVQIKPADSLLSNIAYTVTDADYAATNGTTFKNFTAAKALQFLGTKYPAAVEKQLSVLSYVYYEGGVTTSAGVSVTETFLYLNAAWNKIYQVSQAQYISAGKLSVFNFGSADEPNLVAYFNTFLKSDAAVAAKAKNGDIKYVSFAYFLSNKTYQRVKALIFDGTNWGAKPVLVAALPFLKKNGTWIPDPTVYYTLIKADFTTVGNSNAGTTAGRANFAQFGSFDVTGGANSWTDAQINDALIAVLINKYPNAPVDPGIVYNITFAYYKGPAPTAIKSFVKTDTGFVFVPPAQ